MSPGIKRIFVICVLIALAVISFFAVRQALGRRVHMNEVSAVGNTAGNLYNGGLFCENGDLVFFSNPLDAGCLYSMSPDETRFQKLSTISARSINAVGNFVYFYMDSASGSTAQGLGSVVKEYGIYRARKDGKYEVCLVREVAQTILVGGSYIYFQQGDDASGTLQRIRIDKKDRSTVSDQHINPACYNEGVIYYGGITTDHNLYELNVEREGGPVRIMNGNVYLPIISGSYVYYLDAAESYRLTRYHVPSGNTEPLTQVGADAFNMNDQYVFFDSQFLDPAGLYRIPINGGTPELLMPGAYNSLHLTSQYLYFKSFGDDTSIYHMPLNGAPVPTLFTPGVR